MNITRVILAAIIAAVLPIAARAAAWDLRLQQYDASNRPREVVISPAANSLVGFSGTKALVNITPGPNITISNNTISATGGVADGDKGNITVAGENWTIEPTGVTPSTYGNATHSPRLTVAPDGRITLVEPIAIAPTNGVIKNSTFTAGQLVYIINSTTGEIGSIPGATYNSSNTTISLGNLAVGNMAVGAVSAPWSPSTGGTGSVNSHNIVTTAPASVGGNNTGDQNTFVRIKVAGQNDILALTPTANFTVNATGGLVATTNNTTGELTLSGAGIGGSAVTGDIKFILDGASVPSGWALTGANGIPAVTPPDSDVKAVIKMSDIVATPTFSPPAGEVASGTVVTISTDTSGATIQSTGNGTDPSRSVGATGSTVTVSSNQTVKAMAYKDGEYLIDSAIASAAYTIAPSGPSLIASVSGNSTFGGDTFTLSSVNTTGASTIILVKTWYGTTEPTITDDKGNTPVAAAAASANADNWSVRQYYIDGGTVGTGHTFGLSGTAFYGCLAVLAFNNLSASPKDQDASDEETAWTTLPSGSITPSVANTVSVTGAVFDNGSGTITVPTGYTSGAQINPLADNTVGLLVAWKVLPDTSAVNPAWTASTSYLRGAATHVNYK